MDKLTIHFPEDQDSRSGAIARERGIGVDRAAEFDAYTRFQAIATTGNPDRGLEILDKLDLLGADRRERSG
ncbi:toxin-antitoxin system HicB family antitoxin [Pannus brasiliensis CCIBt3594]|uniref:Toxin-antitoxin system HicB family antitoxin n=1 Tax=Pannus brasiliensis CCIBt3594 TaxID=1427578 RepID=A0AAW9R1H6_9CHRO